MIAAAVVVAAIAAAVVAAAMIAVVVVADVDARRDLRILLVRIRTTTIIVATEQKIKQKGGEYPPFAYKKLKKTNGLSSYADSSANASSACEWPFYGAYASFRLASSLLRMN
jgi:hypothetical protein